MRPLVSAAVAAVVLTAMAPRPALAQDALLPDTKIVVVDPKERASWGGRSVAKTLREKLEAAGGRVIPAATYAKALKKLKIKGRAANDPENIAKAGKEAGADYVLVLSITKKGWLYTANAVLFGTASGEQQMDFKSGYYKPKKEASDRGERIARVTVEKLLTLGTPGGAVAVAAPPPPDDMPDPKPLPRDDQRVSSARDRLEDPPSGSNERVDDSPPKTNTTAVARNDPPPARNDPPPRSSAPAAQSRARPDRITEPRERPSEGRDLVRATVQGGAGVLHTFDLDSSDGRRSRLSYQLDPLALISGEVEVLLPVANTGVFARAAFSPVRFQITVGTTNDEPSGSILDLAFGLKLHLTLTGEGRDAVQLSPLAGLRLGILGVADHPASLILGSTTIAPFVGAELTLPITAGFEALVGADIGLIVAYSEAPAQSKNGEFGNGVQFGAGLGLRYWLSDAIGIAFDGRFDLRSIGLTGAALRQTPAGETLTDASIGNRDLRVSVGVALRL